MNWIFEAYSNVYNTAMGQRPLHHRPGSLTAAQKQKLRAQMANRTYNFS